MGRNSKQPLPAWYYRMVRLTLTRDRDPYPEDFDEDISDLEGKSEKEEDEDEESEDEESEDEEYPESDRSYTGSDAGYYYELKEQREDRKRQLRDYNEQTKKDKENEYAINKAKEEETRHVYETLQSAAGEKGSKKRKKAVLIESLIDKSFDLYSADYVTHFFRSNLDYHRIDFYLLDWIEEGTKEGKAEEDSSSNTASYPQAKGPRLDAKQEVQGQILFNSDCAYGFELFSPPKYAGLEKHYLRTNSKHSVTIQFLSNDYLKLKAPRELLCQEGTPPPHLPEVFDFVAIRRGSREEREKRRKKEEAWPQPPSPKETWFEMTHPMGWWNQSMW
ncbi:hypothetical protein BDV12DRAFT_180375 [Aspergillus spectabilis]